MAFKNRSPLKNTMNKSQLKKPKNFENIIIIKGRTITKKEVFELRQYFDGMSSSKKYILIEDFM